MSLHKQIRWLIIVFITGLLISGLTAFPLEHELKSANQIVQRLDCNSAFCQWINTVYRGVRETNSSYPFIAYGTDWLAFAHLVIAISFVGPLRDPIKNIWVVEWGLICCVAIFPLALIAGYVRSIPFYWQLIDMMFGLVGGTLLLIVYKKIRRLEHCSVDG